MPNTANSLLLLDKPLLKLNTCTQRKSEQAVLKTETLLHTQHFLKSLCFTNQSSTVGMTVVPLQAEE